MTCMIIYLFMGQIFQNMGLHLGSFGIQMYQLLHRSGSHVAPTVVFHEVPPLFKNPFFLYVKTHRIHAVGNICLRICHKNVGKYTQIYHLGGFKYFYVPPYLGKWSNLTNTFQMGWNLFETTSQNRLTPICCHVAPVVLSQTFSILFPESPALPPRSTRHTDTQNTLTELIDWYSMYEWKYNCIYIDHTTLTEILSYIYIFFILLSI